MRALSLGLSGSGIDHALPPPATGRAAGLSALLHGVGIAVLVVAPLLHETTAPDAATASGSILLQPNVAPPSLTRREPRKTPSTSHRSRPVPARVAVADPPLNVSLSDLPDLAPHFGGPGDEPGPRGTEPIQAGNCPLGSVCGEVGPIAEPTPRELPRVGGVIKEPKLLAGDPPRYPAIALAAGASGRVILEALVSRDGLVADCRILESNPLFDDAAIASVRSRRYAPLLLNGVATDFLVTVTVRFRLNR